MIVVKLTRRGTCRVLTGDEGLTFIVDKVTTSGDGTGHVMHVRDYRYPTAGGRPWQIWSLSPGDYEIIAEATDEVPALRLDPGIEATREAFRTIAARDGIEAQRGINDVFPGDPYRMRSPYFQRQIDAE